MPRLPLLTVLLAACASAGAVGPGVDACDGDREQLRAARGRGDDRTADQVLARLARGCPGLTAGALVQGGTAARAPLPHPRLARVTYEWQVRLGPQDRLLWAGTYLDGARRADVAPGPHQLEVEVDVNSGGRTFQLRRSLALVLQARTTDIQIGVTTAAGPQPFQLEVKERPSLGDLRISEGSRIVSISTRDVLGKGTPGACTGPQRRAAPPFAAPAELLDSGAPAILMKNCIPTCSQGGSTRLDGGGDPPHPRLLGAAVDWLRRFEYQTPCCWFPAEKACDHVGVRFDKASLPPPGVATF